ncbi:hypothetical protein T492DRAFT_1152654, partial [Pavlovales sp. CCMP2436]
GGVPLGADGRGASQAYRAHEPRALRGFCARGAEGGGRRARGGEARQREGVRLPGAAPVRRHRHGPRLLARCRRGAHASQGYAPPLAAPFFRPPERQEAQRGGRTLAGDLDAAHVHARGREGSELVGAQRPPVGEHRRQAGPGHRRGAGRGFSGRALGPLAQQRQLGQEVRHHPALRQERLAQGQHPGQEGHHPGQEIAHGHAPLWRQLQVAAVDAGRRLAQRLGAARTAASRRAVLPRARAACLGPNGTRRRHTHTL